jgi:putative membrane protein
MAVNNFLPTVVSGLVLAAALGASPAAAQQTRALVSDSVFIQTAASNGLLQVKLAGLAEKKASSPAVIEFGKRMKADYTKANEAYSGAAKQAAFPSPTLLRQDQQTFDQFNRTGRGSFDKAYMAEMVKRQGDELRMFQDEAQHGKVQSLKQLASNMLPDLQERLNVATQTAGSVGVQVTAMAEDASPRSAGR